MDIYIGVAVFLSEIILQSCWIRLQNSGKLNFSQKQKEYGPRVEVEVKGATPSMGGVVFILIAAFSAMLVSDYPVIWIFACACGFIGFADDALKFFRNSSEGFSSIKKLCAQIIVSFAFAIWVHINYGINLYDGLDCPFWLGIPLVVFLSVGVQNAVNISDGMDGLAAGLTALSLIGFAVAAKIFSADLAVAFGIALGFLWHNSYPAKVFMGDTGSHFLAGALFSIVVVNGNLIILVPVCFLFGIEVASSAIQIIAIRKFNRKIFEMAPIHHHFQLLGWKETTAVNRFWLLHIIGMSVIFALFRGMSLI